MGGEEEDRGTDGKAGAFLEMYVGLRRIDGRDDHVGSVCGCDVDTSPSEMSRSPLCPPREGLGTVEFFRGLCF